MLARLLPVTAIALALATLLAPGLHADDDAPAAAPVAQFPVKVLKGPGIDKRLVASPFYKRYTKVDEFMVVASKHPADEAISEAAWIIHNMLRTRPDVLTILSKRRIRCVVMAYRELTTDVPEHSSLTPARWWNARARGLGAAPRRPIVSCAEENLLGYAGDPYAGECILIHEFAHTIDSDALRIIHRTFTRRLDAAYQAAIEGGLWAGEYAATNKEEYWAVGVQCYFHGSLTPDAESPRVDTREELRDYDKPLFALIDEMFKQNPWRYTPPKTGERRPHLKGYDPKKAPTFRWPGGLQAWYELYERRKKSGQGRVRLTPLVRKNGPHRSPVSKQMTQIAFKNETDRELRVFWVGYSGERVPYATVRAGGTQELTTYANHVWVLVDRKGAEVARFQASAKPSLAVIK